MKRVFLLVVVAMVFLTGCVEYGLIIKVNQDGSGEIVENMLLANQIMNLTQALNFSDFDLYAFTPGRQQDKASYFGEGVSFSTLEEITTETKQGYKSVYLFDDINKVRIAENAINNTVDELTESIQHRDSYGKGNNESDNYFSFEYDQRKKGTLTIVNNFSEVLEDVQDELDDEVYEEYEDYDYYDDEDDDRSNAAVVKLALQGLKIYTKVEFTNIKKSNVPYENNQITLFEIDMDKIIENKEIFKSLSNDDTTEISKFLNNEKKIDGVVFHNIEKITVDFK